MLADHSQIRMTNNEIRRNIEIRMPKLQRVFPSLIRSADFPVGASRRLQNRRYVPHPFIVPTHGKAHEAFHEPYPLTLSLSPNGGEGVRRTGEGDSERFIDPMHAMDTELL